MPVFNEAPVIGGFLAELAAHARGRTVYLLDSGSTDDTVAEACRAAERSGVELVVVPSPPGLSAAIRHGVAQARQDRLAVIDGDGQHAPAILNPLFNALDAGCDLAVASRAAPGASVSATWPKHRRALTRAVLGALRIAGSCHGVRDPLSGCFALRRALWGRVATRFQTSGFKFLLDLLTVAPALRVAELPIVFRARPDGSSKASARTLWELGISLGWNVLRGRVPRRVLGFGSVGATGSVLDAAVTGVAHTMLGAPFWAARCAGTLVGLSNNYLWNNLMTFRDRRRTSGRLLHGWLLYAACQSFGALVNYGTSIALYRVGAWWLVAVVGGVAAGVTINYFTASRLVWRKAAWANPDTPAHGTATSPPGKIEPTPPVRDTAGV